MKIPPRIVRYGEAMFDQEEIDAVMAQLSDPMGRVPGIHVAESEQRVHPDGLAHCDQIMEHGIMLPCHPTLTREDCEYLYQVLEEFIEAKGEVTVTTPVSELLEG